MKCKVASLIFLLLAVAAGGALLYRHMTATTELVCDDGYGTKKTMIIRSYDLALLEPADYDLVKSHETYVRYKKKGVEAYFTIQRVSGEMTFMLKLSREDTVSYQCKKAERLF